MFWLIALARGADLLQRGRGRLRRLDDVLAASEVVDAGVGGLLRRPGEEGRGGGGRGLRPGRGLALELSLDSGPRAAARDDVLLRALSMHALLRDLEPAIPALRHQLQQRGRRGEGPLTEAVRIVSDAVLRGARDLAPVLEKGGPSLGAVEAGRCEIFRKLLLRLLPDRLRLGNALEARRRPAQRSQDLVGRLPAPRRRRHDPRGPARATRGRPPLGKAPGCFSRASPRRGRGVGPRATKPPRRRPWRRPPPLAGLSRASPDFGRQISWARVWKLITLCGGEV